MFLKNKYLYNYFVFFLKAEILFDIFEHWVTICDKAKRRYKRLALPSDDQIVFCVSNNK